MIFSGIVVMMLIMVMMMVLLRHNSVGDVHMWWVHDDVSDGVS